jgi:hypothetical protein
MLALVDETIDRIDGLQPGFYESIFAGRNPKKAIEAWKEHLSLLYPQELEMGLDCIRFMGIKIHGLGHFVSLCVHGHGGWSPERQREWDAVWQGKTWKEVREARLAGQRMENAAG